MNKSFSYSVAIRTIGKTTEKYLKLLDSIKRQVIQPEKIIIVIPYGCEQPERYLGNEEYHYSKKGMITQRLAAVEYIQSDYILFCDDDVEFSEHFVENLLETSEETGMDCLAGPLLEFFPPRNLKYLFASLLGSTCVMQFRKENQYVRLLKSGGWSYNWDIDTSEHRVYYTDSFPWTCFLVKKGAVDSIHFEDELWAEKFGYAAYDDQIFAAKLKINHYKSCIVSDAAYLHNDGKTSTAGQSKNVVYARAFNRRVYWHRFIYSTAESTSSRFISALCFYYSAYISTVYDFALLLAKKKSWEVVCASLNGYKDAGQFTRSEEYRAMNPPIIRVN